MVESRVPLASNVADYAPGVLIADKYRLERFLDEGTHASVWLAHNIALDAEVAIKIVHGALSDPIAALRLEKEARAAAQIAHPAVVRVFDLGRTSNGDPFIVMEYLRGEGLGSRLMTCGRLSPVEAVRTLLPIADVLQVAHARGIVNRDLKLENVFLAESGAVVQPKLVGVAYVSPERASPDEGAEIRSLCVVLYECLTGALPVEAAHRGELIRRIEAEAPRPAAVRAFGDLELWEILGRGLTTLPSERWANMQSLGRALAQWLRARGVEDDISGLRLDSRWLARADTPLPVSNGPEPISGVRRVGRRAKAGVPQATERPRYGRASRSLFAAVACLAVSTTLALGYLLPAPRSLEANSVEPARTPNARLETAPPLSEPRARPATPPPESAPAPESASDVRVSIAPLEEGTPSNELARTPLPPAVAAPDGGVPKRRAEHGASKADLLDPY